MLLKNKKLYMEITPQVVTCSLSLTDSYVDCIIGSTVNIVPNISNNTSPTVTITTQPTKGSVTIRTDNTITYTSTTSGTTDFFVYTVVDGACTDSATVYITIDSELIPLPNYRPLSVSKNSTLFQACNTSGANTVNIFMDGATFAISVNLYNDIHGIYKAPYGYYTNGTIYRFWNGIEFIGVVQTC